MHNFGANETQASAHQWLVCAFGPVWRRLAPPSWVNVVDATAGQNDHATPLFHPLPPVGWCISKVQVSRIRLVLDAIRFVRQYQSSSSLSIL